MDFGGGAGLRSSSGGAASHLQPLELKSCSPAVIGGQDLVSRIIIQIKLSFHLNQN